MMTNALSHERITPINQILLLAANLMAAKKMVGEHQKLPPSRAISQFTSVGFK